MKNVHQLFPTDIQLRTAMENAVSDAVASTLAASGLSRFRKSHLKGAMEGVVDVATKLCIAWTRSDADAAALARDLSVLLTNQVDATLAESEARANDQA